MCYCVDLSMNQVRPYRNKLASVQQGPLLAHEQVLRHNDFLQLQVVSSIILSGAGLLVIKIGHNTPSSSFQPEH